MIEVDAVMFWCLIALLAMSVGGVIALGNRAARNRLEALVWKELFFKLIAESGLDHRD